MAKLNTNRAPWFDDYDPAKNYLKILFKPGMPVQARELNQIQSMFQRQIENFANHVFVNGSKVSNARTALVAKEYVRLMDNPNVAEYPDGAQLVGETSGVRASLVKGVNVEGDDPATIYVVYRGTGIDGVRGKFLEGERINVLDENGVQFDTVTVRCPSCPGSGLTDTISPLGRGQFFTVDEGIFYFEGMFIETNRQEIIVTKYLQTEGDRLVGFKACKIGLDMVQTVVDHYSDPSLLDPSLGYPNSTAPGADRYKVELKLVVRSPDVADGENFILLCEVDDQMRISYIKSDSEYADIMDMLAKRTYEQAGDYTVRPFKLTFFESKMQHPTDPYGWSLDGDENDLVAALSPAVAYVRGYRVETVSDTPVIIPKARETRPIESFTQHFEKRAHVIANPVGPGIYPNELADPNTMGSTLVSIYDDVTDGTLANGNVIGSLRVNDARYIGGDISGGTAEFEYYIHDLTMLPGHKFSDAKSLVNVDRNFYCNIRADSITGHSEVYNPNNQALIYRLSRDHIRSLRDIADNDNGSINISVRKKFNGVLDSNGTTTFTTTSNEYFDGASGLVAWRVQGGTFTPINPATEITVTSTSMVVDAGAGAAGATVYVIADVLRTNQKEKTKTPQNTSYVTSNAPSNDIGDVIHLGVADAYRLRSAMLHIDGDPDPNNIVDVTDEFELVPNISDTAYGESMVRRVGLSQVTIVPEHRLTLNFDYYQHSGTAGYFTIDSYGPAINDPNSGVTYDTLGSYTSKAGDVYPLASSIDFRPIIMGAAPINSLLPVNDSTMIFDLDFYLARTDLILINKDGRLYAKMGIPSETPRPPKKDDNAMALYEVHLSPYTYTLRDVKTKYIENRRYTMRDIGAIDQRLKNVEYYVALNLLERSAADMAILDDNGFDRFKNGFIADNFGDFQAADLGSLEFKACADRGQNQLRPSFKAYNKRLVFDPAKSSGYVLRGNVAMRPYNETVLLSNPYATKHISINPYLQYNQSGQMVLSPNNDVWTDSTYLPEIIIDADSGMDAMLGVVDPDTILGSDWGSWVDQNSTILNTEVTTHTHTDEHGNTVITTTTATTTVDSRTDEYNINDIVTDVRIIPFMREIEVEFVATKLKPNTRVYPFFDGEPVSEHCRDIGFQLTSDNADHTTALIEYGSPLITDINGEIRGVFRIPEGQFFTGEKQFLLSDDPNLTGDPDMETTNAEAMFFAGGLDTTRQNVTLNITTPTVRVDESTEVEIIPPPPEPSPPNPPDAPDAHCDRRIGSRWVINMCRCATMSAAQQASLAMCNDPVAQAFTMDNDGFITGLDLFFKQVDIFSDRIFVEIRNMVNGYPGEMRLAVKQYSPDQIQSFCSDDSTKAFRVEFDVPVFLESDTRYCFVVGGFSPDTRIWMSRLGQEVVNIPDKIVEMPASADTSFRSLNGSTWNAEQYEQVKFTLYQAEFEPGTMELTFVNDDDGDDLALPENPFQMEAGETRVRVFAKNHGYTVGDWVTLSVVDKQPVLIDVADSLPPQVGQRVQTATGEAVIRSVRKDASAPGAWELEFEDTSGQFAAGQGFVAESKEVAMRDPFLISALDSRIGATRRLNRSVGTFINDSYSRKYPTGNIGGIPVATINTNHQVAQVDSPDSFIIVLSQPATMTGRFGGSGCMLHGLNRKYDVFNVSGVHIPYRSLESWEYHGIGHGDIGTLFDASNYERFDPIPFALKQDRFLNQPFKVASGTNELINLGPGNRSIEVVGKFESTTTATSAMVNLDTFSATLISNRVEQLDIDARQSKPHGEATYVPETDPLHGSEVYKYVTRTINLASAANDIHIYFDAYKDINADFDVYVKRVSAYDEISIDEAPWMHVSGLQKNRSSVDLKDLIEYHIVASEHIAGWKDSDDEYIPFIGFKVKLVGKTTNSSKPPLFGSFRAIAVT